MIFSIHGVVVEVMQDGFRLHSDDKVLTRYNKENTRLKVGDRVSVMGGPGQSESGESVFLSSTVSKVLPDGTNESLSNSEKEAFILKRQLNPKEGSQRDGKWISNPVYKWKVLGDRISRYEVINPAAYFNDTASCTYLHRTYQVYDTMLQREGRMVITCSSDLANLLKTNLTVLAQTPHPGLEPIWDFGEVGEFFYFVLPPEAASGQRLSERLGQPYDSRLASYIINDLAATLTFLHQRNIIHGNLIPREILLGQKVVLKNPGLLVMLEIAQNKFKEDKPDEYEEVKYLEYENFKKPPEIYSATSPFSYTPQSDQYQLAWVGYMLLTGGVPEYLKIAAENSKDRSSTDNSIHDPFEFNSSLPRATWPVLQKAMSKNPADRYGSVAEFSQAFQATILAMDTPATNVSVHSAPVPSLPVQSEVNVAVDTGKPKKGLFGSLFRKQP